MIIQFVIHLCKINCQLLLEICEIVCNITHSLPYCSAQRVGVIVRLERESFQVLTNENKTIQVKHQAINKKKDSRHAVALDSDNNQLQVKDIVKVIDGAHAVSIFKEIVNVVVIISLYLCGFTHGRL